MRACRAERALLIIFKIRKWFVEVFRDLASTARTSKPRSFSIRVGFCLAPNHYFDRLTVGQFGQGNFDPPAGLDLRLSPPFPDHVYHSTTKYPSVPRPAPSRCICLSSGVGPHDCSRPSIFGVLIAVIGVPRRAFVLEPTSSVQSYSLLREWKYTPSTNGAPSMTMPEPSMLTGCPQQYMTLRTIPAIGTAARARTSFVAIK